LGGFARKGRGMDAARFSQGLGCPLEKTRPNPSERRNQAAWGGLFFGYFLLATQKKVSRLPVREPALN
jgi:hypothetical protein